MDPKTMRHILSVPNQGVDLNYVKVALALAYAHAKFLYALQNHSIPVISPEYPHPEFLDETAYLYEEFKTALLEYGDTDIEEMLKDL